MLWLDRPLISKKLLLRGVLFVNRNLKVDVIAGGCRGRRGSGFAFVIWFLKAQDFALIPPIIFGDFSKMVAMKNI